MAAEICILDWVNSIDFRLLGFLLLTYFIQDLGLDGYVITYFPRRN